MFKKSVQWLLYSSANPSKIALTVKSAVVGVIPIIMLFTGVSGDDASGLADTISNIVFLGLSLVSSVGVAYGLLRKIWISFTNK